MIRGVLGKPGHGKTLYLLYCMYEYIRKGWLVATNIHLTAKCPFQKRVVLIDGPEVCASCGGAGQSGDGERWEPCGGCAGRGFTVPFPTFQMPEVERCAACKGKLPTCERCGGSGQLTLTAYRAFWHYMPRKVCYVLDEFDNEFDSMDFAKLAQVSRDGRLYFKQHRKREDVIIYAVQNIDNLWTRIRRMTESFVVCEWNYRTRPLLRYLPMSWSSFIRAEFSDVSLSPRHFIGEGYFKYREAAEMFAWYDTRQIVGDVSQYNWGAVNGNDFARRAVSGAV